MHNRNNGLRTIIFERDSYTCVLCTRPASDLHHFVKRSHGGTNHPHNLVALCRIHHDLVHGTRWQGVELTTAEAQQAILEYLHDYYACDRQEGRWAGD